ncbi:MAG: hypothetical protein IPO20_23040 [Gammaproteobacteria bacterium]|nr:hypothetical protein [Gammaproteobacteria bacterium]
MVGIAQRAVAPGMAQTMALDDGERRWGVARAPEQAWRELTGAGTGPRSAGSCRRPSAPRVAVVRSGLPGAIEGRTVEASCAAPSSRPHFFEGRGYPPTIAFVILASGLTQLSGGSTHAGIEQSPPAPGDGAIAHSSSTIAISVMRHEQTRQPVGTRS